MRGLGRLTGAVVATSVVVGLTRTSQRRRSMPVFSDAEVVSDDVAVSPPKSEAEPPETPSRPHKAVIANRVSYLATAAMIGVLVVWAVGGFDADTGFQPVSAGSIAVAQQAVPPVGTARVSPRGTGAQPAQDQDVPPAALPQAEPSEASTPQPEVVEVQRANPVSVHIPAIGVNAPVIALATDPSGALAVPTDFSQTGWWTGGPEPGEPGPAVVVGHVDSYVGPAVFFNLRTLTDGDRINIARADGSTAIFEVRGAVQALKSAFPTDLVYGQTSDSQLRLVTCDGDFANGSYLGNLIVTAELLRETTNASRGIQT
ncbi:hypothetical protein BH24ACT15_BH24ACT15_29500 [soil metagenome]